MHRLYKELTSLNGMAEKTISRQLLRRNQLLDVQQRIEVLILVKTVKLQLHLYLFDNEVLELWNQRISNHQQKAKQEKEFQSRINNRLLTKKPNSNMAMMFLAERAAQEELKKQHTVKSRVVDKLLSDSQRVRRSSQLVSQMSGRISKTLIGE